MTKTELRNAVNDIVIPIFYLYTNFGNDRSMQREHFRILKMRHSVLGYIAYTASVVLSRARGAVTAIAVAGWAHTDAIDAL